MTQEPPAAAPLRVEVFLASPGDVSDEQALALRVLERLLYDTFLRGRISVESVAWDKPGADTPMLATMPPQEAIEARRRKRIGNPTAYTRVSAVVSFRSTACWTSSRTGWSVRWGKPSRGKRWEGNFRVGGRVDFEKQTTGKWLAQPGHRAVDVVQLKLLHTGNGIVLAPAFSSPVRARREQSMQHAKEDRPFHGEFELAMSEQLVDHALTSALTLQPLEHLHRPDAP
jgi:hypothetical protein